MATTKPNEDRAKNEDKFKAKKNTGFEKRSNYREFYEDNDEDYPKTEVKGHKSSGQTKTKVPPDTPSDKYETMMRLEREKKAMQKKIIDEEYSKSKRPMKQMKHSKTNWTKHYENGFWDESDYSE